MRPPLGRRAGATTVDQDEALTKARLFARAAHRLVRFDTAVVFGSYAAGSAREHSDVDVGLIVESLETGSDYLVLLRDLYGLASQVDVHIEPHLFVRSEDRSGFAAHVEETGIRISP